MKRATRGAALRILWRAAVATVALVAGVILAFSVYLHVKRRNANERLAGTPHAGWVEQVATDLRAELQSSGFALRIEWGEPFVAAAKPEPNWLIGSETDPIRQRLFAIAPGEGFTPMEARRQALAESLRVTTETLTHTGTADEDHMLGKLRRESFTWSDGGALRLAETEEIGTAQGVLRYWTIWAGASNAVPAMRERLIRNRLRRK